MNVKVEQIPLKTKYTVFGYVKRNHDGNEIIPNDIINIILLYYYISLKFYSSKYGKFLQFIDDDQVKINKDHRDYATCLFGDHPITNDICNIFKITFRVFSEQEYLHFRFGYVTSINSVIDWNDALGNGPNGCGILSTYNGNFYIYDKEHSAKKINSAQRVTKSGDIFSLSFNFELNIIQIEHDNKNLDELSLKGNKSIITAFSLDKKNDLIKILKYEFF